MAKILIIEDSEDLRNMLTVVLETYGHEVTASSENINFNSIISRFKPQLLLLDVWLKKISGKEICKQIKATNANLPIILMSANAKLLVDHESCNADDILEKPFDIIDLKNKIDKLLAS